MSGFIAAEASGTTPFEDESVRIWHRGDGILILSLKTKMHIIDAGVIAGLDRAVDEAGRNYKGLVIWSGDTGEGGPFSAGADLRWLLSLFASGGAGAVDAGIASLQQAFQAVKYARVPVVAAVAGLALGGGCELLLHAAKRVVATESRIGLVEAGVGLIPAGGGLKEAVLRAVSDAKGHDPLPFLKHSFINVATAVVSKSALAARRMGYLRAGDVIVRNPRELLSVAVSEAHAMFDAGYRPPPQEPVPVAGRQAIDILTAQRVDVRDGDSVPARLIATVMAGGDVDPGGLVSEQRLLDLERRYFVELFDHPETRQRILDKLQSGRSGRG